MRSAPEELRLTAAEAAALAVLAAPVAIVTGAYVLDLAGLRFSPLLMLAVAVAASGSAAAIAFPHATHGDGAVRRWLLPSAGLLAWLLWLAWPGLLPLSTGPDLTHHLILIHFIEQHWRLVHDPSLERFLGEMAQYTPGSHILASLAGAWSRTDGVRALHALQATTVALKAGFLLLIAERLLPPRAPRALALIGATLLLASPRYFLGGFTEYGFLAQVVAELFVVAMWWMAVAWDDAPDRRMCVAFGLAGAAAFLTWPVYAGPPSLTFFLVIVLRSDLTPRLRLHHLGAAFIPLGGFALTYLVGRFGWLQLAGTGGAAPWPSVGSYGWPLVAMSAAGLLLATMRRRARVTILFALAVGLQAAAFYVLASRSGAPQPYMALKMFYLLLWPMAAAAALIVGEVWAGLWRESEPTAARTAAAWGLVAITLFLVARPLVRQPALLHPLPPAVSMPLYEAGKWARANLPAGCIEYLVGDDETAYWLHLAVLGNPRMSDRTGDNATYEPKDAVMRWLTPGGLPYGIADLPALSRDVRSELDVVRQFDTAAVVRRRGPSSCDAGR